MSEGFFDRRRPLTTSQIRTRGWREMKLTYKYSTCTYPTRLVDFPSDARTNSPLKINRLDNKPQRWTNSGNIFFHNLLHNGRFAGIV